MNYSVFEIDITQSAKKEMISKLKNIIDKKEDSIRIYPIDKFMATKAQEIGKGRVPFTQESASVF